MFPSSSIPEDIMHRYSVPAMTCGHCAGTIDRAIKLVDLKAEVDIDLKRQEVSVRSAIGAAQIETVIQAAGYETSLAK
jgi:copper chaperone